MRKSFYEAEIKPLVQYFMKSGDVDDPRRASLMTLLEGSTLAAQRQADQLNTLAELSTGADRTAFREEARRWQRRANKYERDLKAVRATKKAGSA